MSTPHEKTQEGLRALEWFLKLKEKGDAERHRQTMTVAETILKELQEHRGHTAYALASAHPWKAIVFTALFMVWVSGLLPQALPLILPLLPQILGAALGHPTITL